MATGVNGGARPQGVSALKTARLQQKLCKILGLKRGASVAQIMAALQPLKAKRDEAEQATSAADGHKLGNARGAAGAGDLADALRLVTSLRSAAKAGTQLGRQRPVSLPEPLQAVRDELRKPHAAAVVRAAQSVG